MKHHNVLVFFHIGELNGSVREGCGTESRQAGWH